MTTLPDRVFLVGISFFLSALWIYGATPFWPAKFVLENLPIVLRGCSCMQFFSCFFHILSLSLTLDVLIITCFGVSHFGFIFGTLFDSWSWRSVSFPKLGKFSTIIYSSKISAHFSLSLLLGTYTIMWMLVDWCSPISPTDHLHCFHSFFSLWATLIGWVLLLCLWSDWYFPLLLLICCWISLV